MDLLDVEPSHPPRFDTTIQAWVLTRHADVDAALRDPRLELRIGGRLAPAVPTGCHGGFLQIENRKLAAGYRAGCIANLSARCEPNGTLDLVHDFAEPWSAAVAGIVTGQSFAEAQNWARAVFQRRR